MSKGGGEAQFRGVIPHMHLIRAHTRTHMDLLCPIASNSIVWVEARAKARARMIRLVPIRVRW